MRLHFDEVKSTLSQVLKAHGCAQKQADEVAYEMARNSLEGIYTHGINRFARLVRNIDEGIVKPGVTPVRIGGFGAIENYDGGLGLGITNARICMTRAMVLALWRCAIPTTGCVRRPMATRPVTVVWQPCVSPTPYPICRHGAQPIRVSATIRWCSLSHAGKGMLSWTWR